MRKQLEVLDDDMKRLDPLFLRISIEEIRDTIREMLKLLDVALPKEVDPD